MRGKDIGKAQASLDMGVWSLQHPLSSYSPTVLILNQWGLQASIPTPTLQIGKLFLENVWALIVPSASAQTEQCEN